MWNDYLTWGRVMDVVLIVLGIVEALEFFADAKARAWRNIKTWLELGAAVVLLLLGAGDWHQRTLEHEHDQAQSSALDNAIHRSNDAETASAAAKAESAAARAASDAARAEAEQLKKQVEPLVNLARSHYPNLDLRDGLARLTNEVSTLIEKTTPRHLAPNQQASIASAVRAAGGLPPFTGQTLISDSEAHAYMDEILTALVMGGCHVSGSGVDTGIPPALKGVYVATAMPDARGVTSMPKAAATLVRILVAAGVPAKLTGRPGLSNDQFQLIVGGKP
ncbi:MAG TPA: hypothetical protein VGG74_07645 [Kofleriaceae bacterium]|jgi:hypothetical protein